MANQTAATGRLINNTARPGPTPATRLVTRVAAKNKTNDAPLPVQGDSRTRSPNALATIVSANRYRTATLPKALLANRASREGLSDPVPMRELIMARA